jgi:hypothetical protein
MVILILMKTELISFLTIAFETILQTIENLFYNLYISYFSDMFTTTKRTTTTIATATTSTE